MPLSFAFALLAFAIVLIVFIAANRSRGLRLALVAGALTCVAMLALYVVAITLITATM